MQRKLGLIISTHGSYPYIETHLSNSKNLNIRVPTLVYDDCSSESRQINKICGKYNADFHVNNVHLGHQSGDIYSFYVGLMWAERLGLEFLVKMSRRFIPLKDWHYDLRKLILVSDDLVSTFGNYCSGSRFLLRTECLAMRVEDWLPVMDMIYKKAVCPEDDLVAELFMYNLVKDHIRKIKKIYGEWSFVGTSRFEKNDNAMWHITSTPENYLNYAKSLGLNYTSAEDFEVR